MSESTPTLPSEPGGEMKTPAKKPTAKQLDDRASQLEQRESDLNEREQKQLAREAEPFDGTLPDRTSIDEGAAGREHDAHNPKAVRQQMQQGKQLADTLPYEQKYQDKQLLWVNDLTGDVQRWIDAGAEPIPVLNPSGRTFEGITDKVESKWVRSVGGSDGMGGHFWVYLMMIDPDVYYDVRIAPQRERQEMIRRAMKIGADTSDYTQGPKLPTYAPNLPTGDERGIDIQRETVAAPER